MEKERYNKTIKPQAGYGLLFLLLIGSVGYSLLFPFTLYQEDATAKNFRSLKLAKKQLLAYARSFPFTESSSKNSRFGLPPMLPCPSLKNVSSDGAEKGSCGDLNKASVGLFPWKSLDMQALFSTQGECLWYVVAGNVKRNNIQAKTHFNLDSDQWIKYQDKYGVAALLSPKETRTREAKTKDFQCRKSYDPDDVFSLSSSATFDTQNTDVVIDLSNEDSFDVELISRSELLEHYVQGVKHSQLIDQLGETLVKCVSSMSSFSSGTLKWNLPFAAQIAIADDRIRSSYQAKTGLHSGRFPYDFGTMDLKSQCSAFFNNYSSLNFFFETSAYFRVWLHSKNQWFLKTMMNCQLNGDNCLKSHGQSFLVIVVYANQVLNGQSRLSHRFDSTDREDLRNYLEGNTLDIFHHSTTNLTASSSIGNDRRYCLGIDKAFKTC